jgi:hypothetical protein
VFSIPWVFPGWPGSSSEVSGVVKPIIRGPSYSREKRRQQSNAGCRACQAASVGKTHNDMLQYHQAPAGIRQGRSQAGRDCVRGRGQHWLAFQQFPFCGGARGTGWRKARQDRKNNKTELKWDAFR